LLAKPSPLNINLGSGRFSSSTKRRDIPHIPNAKNDSYINEEADDAHGVLVKPIGVG
jgi:hypothetical protein